MSMTSSFQIEEVLSFAKIKPANLQVESHPHLPNLELLEFCKKQGISFVAYSPLGEFEIKREKGKLNIAGQNDTIMVYTLSFSSC